MTRLVLVPGFTQTVSSWRGVVAEFERDLDVHAVDVPDCDSFGATAAAIGDEGGRGVYCGYSMGGRLCLRLALDRPALVAGLVLVSATPGIEDPSERAARIASDEKLAQFVEEHGVDAFLDRWLAQPLFAGVPADAPGVADRHTFSADFLARCLRHLGTGTMDPMWDRLASLRIPVGIVWGDGDRKFQEIGQLMSRAIANSIPFEVAGAGHAVLLEQPRALARAIESSLAYMRD